MTATTTPIRAVTQIIEWNVKHKKRFDLKALLSRLDISLAQYNEKCATHEWTDAEIKRITTYLNSL